MQELDQKLNYVKKYFEGCLSSVEDLDPIIYTGKVKRVSELFVESEGPQVTVGEICEICSVRSNHIYKAEVVGVSANTVQLMPYVHVRNIEVGSSVRALGNTASINVSNELIGRVINSRGEPIDDLGPIKSFKSYRLDADPPNVLNRKRIDEQIFTGVKAIDFFTPVAKGQRIGIFAGSGVGKSTLLGMIAKKTSSDLNVIALIGERGREVAEFVQDILGEEGMSKSVVIVSSSAETPLSRVRGAFAATAVAEFFRDQGKDVMLFFDSVTRFAMAQREIGLSSGEVASSRGYTPSVFTLLPKLLERCGTSDKGTITGIYTVLVEGDDFDEPITDNVRAIIDGHIILDRSLAERGHYPAIDVCGSISRLERSITSKVQRNASTKLRKLINAYNEELDYINMGAYVKGSNNLVDEAIKKMDSINKFVFQDIDSSIDFNNTIKEGLKIAGVEYIDE